ncbi:hypothetical protein [Enterococcus bulliens]
MWFILGTLLVFVISIKLASVLAVGLMMLHFRIKRDLQKMTLDKWNRYFAKIGPKGIFRRILAYYWLVLTLIALINMNSFWHGNLAYAITLLLAGAVYLMFKFISRKDDFQKTMNKRFHD